MFVLIIGSTEISSIPGISAAGANPCALPYTAPADADMIWWGKPRVTDKIPLDPQGHPTPAIITRSARLEAHFPAVIVRAGSSVAPRAPFIETGASVSRDPSKETAVPDAKEIFDRGRELSRVLSSDSEPLVIAESVPGGTTTAALVLDALGYSGSVSSAGPVNPLNLKAMVRDRAFARLGIGSGDLAGKGIAAITEFGDAMQSLASGLVCGAPGDKEIVLAGGTQMLAVAGALRHMGVDRPLTVATTCYIQRDESADFPGLAGDMAVTPWYAPLDFSGSVWPGLRDYEKGYVKEGAGAGGAVWYAARLGIPAEAVIARTESLYSDLMGSDCRTERQGG